MGGHRPPKNKKMKEVKNMYRINILDRGKYNNVVTGYRYKVTKNAVLDLADFLMYFGCEFEIQQLKNFRWTCPENL